MKNRTRSNAGPFHIFPSSALSNLVWLFGQISKSWKHPPWTSPLNKVFYLPKLFLSFAVCQKDVVPMDAFFCWLFHQCFHQCYCYTHDTLNSRKRKRKKTWLVVQGRRFSGAVEVSPQKNVDGYFSQSNANAQGDGPHNGGFPGSKRPAMG